MNVLGISAFAGESAAALIRDGRLVAWADEATFSDLEPGVPWRAAAWCLEQGEVIGPHLDAVALAHKPLLAFDHLVSSALADAPSSWDAFAARAERRLADLALGLRLRARLGFTGPLLYVERLEALAQAAFAASGFERAALLVAGGDGEWADAALGKAEGRSLALLAQLDHPHGLSALWRAFCRRAGLSARKLAALSAQGAAHLPPETARELVDLKADGSLRIDSARLEGASLEALFCRDGAADAAAFLQSLTEETLLRMAAEALRVSGCEDLCVAGSFAANETAMARLREAASGRVFAAAGPLDAAVGAATAAWRRALQRESVDLSSPKAPPAPFACEPSGRLLSPRAAAGRLAARAACGAAYFLALTPYSLPLRLLGVEFVDERFRASGTYWKERPREAEGLRAYRRAF